MKKQAKKAAKKAARRRQPDRPLIYQWTLEGVVKPRFDRLLREATLRGYSFTSRAQFHKAFQKAYRCTVSLPTFTKWCRDLNITPTPSVLNLDPDFDLTNPEPQPVPDLPKSGPAGFLAKMRAVKAAEPEEAALGDFRFDNQKEPAAAAKDAAAEAIALGTSLEMMEGDLAETIKANLQYGGAQGGQQ